MSVVVNNLPANVESFIVARAVDGELWFWGSWGDEAKAKEVAAEICGIVVAK